MCHTRMREGHPNRARNDKVFQDFLCHRSGGVRSATITDCEKTNGDQSRYWLSVKTDLVEHRGEIYEPRLRSI
jgi:hypothetical protein